MSSDFCVHAFLLCTIIALPGTFPVSLYALLSHFVCLEAEKVTQAHLYKLLSASWLEIILSSL